MNTKTLPVAARSGSGKGPNRRLRASGLVPAVVYGCKSEPTMVSLRSQTFLGLLSGAAGVNQIIQLEIDGEAGPNVIMRDYQVHPVTRKLLHVDFLRVDPDQSITVDVPLSVTGESSIVKAGGKQRIVARTVKVTCKPADIPDTVSFDVSHVDRATVSYIDEVTFPEGVEPVFRRKYPIVSISVAKAEIEETEEETEEEEGEE